MDAAAFAADTTRSAASATEQAALKHTAGGLQSEEQKVVQKASPLSEEAAPQTCPQQPELRRTIANARQCSMGYATRDAIAHFRKMHPEVTAEAAHSLQANLDTSRPLYFWQLYSVLGTNRIVEIVRNLYTRIYADTEEPWLPKAFTRIADVDHHIATQAAFWLDVMGRGKCYHGGEYRLNFHHQHNAAHVMTQVGAARWMHHMRLALDESDLGPDPRVRATIDEFLRVRMEKYAQQHAFQTGDRVYKAWSPEDWVRTNTWPKLGPEPARCPITGQVGECAANAQQPSDDSGLSSGSSSTRTSTP